MNFRIEDARGQCYDGAATMSGTKTGVATQFKSLNGKMLFTHCYGHALNLAIKDACFKVDCLKETFETVYEICNLVEKSPQRDTKLTELREKFKNESKGVHSFCPTRWTVRGETLKSINDNHDELLELWTWSLSVLKDTAMKARITGVSTVMKKFSFYFGCCLGVCLLRQTDNLSKTLQDPRLSAVEGQAVATKVLDTLRKDRNDEGFAMFWQALMIRKENFPEIADPVLPRKRKIPQRFEDGSTGHFFETPEDHYRKIFYEAYDNVINGIEVRFDQEDFKIYVNLQEVILRSFNGVENADTLEKTMEMYKGDFDEFCLETQLKLLPSVAQDAGYQVGKVDVADALKILRNLDVAEKRLLSEVIILAKLLLVAPATNAVSERSFSALKRLKTYLRSTTGDNRLNHLMMIHVHQDKTDELDLRTIANEFIAANDNRKRVFGLLKNKD